MWWMINAAGERCFTVGSEEKAKARLDDWYVDYIYVGQNVYFIGTEQRILKQIAENVICFFSGKNGGKHYGI